MLLVQVAYVTSYYPHGEDGKDRKVSAHPSDAPVQSNEIIKLGSRQLSHGAVPQAWDSHFVVVCINRLLVVLLGLSPGLVPLQSVGVKEAVWPPEQIRNQIMQFLFQTPVNLTHVFCNEPIHAQSRAYICVDIIVEISSSKRARVHSFHKLVINYIRTDNRI